MEIVIGIAVQLGLFALMWWFVSSRKAKAEGVVKKRPAIREKEENA